MKTRPLDSSSFAYGDPRDSRRMPTGRRKITLWQAFVFILALLGIIGFTILVCANQADEKEIKRAFDVGN